MKMGRKEKSKMITSCGFLDDELRRCSKEGVMMADSVETLGRLENQSQEIKATEERSAR